MYKKKRRELLKRFMDKPSIYATRMFNHEYEQQARENLKRSLAKLS